MGANRPNGAEFANSEAGTKGHQPEAQARDCPSLALRAGVKSARVTESARGKAAGVGCPFCGQPLLAFRAPRRKSSLLFLLAQEKQAAFPPRPGKAGCFSYGTEPLAAITSPSTFSRPQLRRSGRSRR